MPGSAARRPQRAPWLSASSEVGPGVAIVARRREQLKLVDLSETEIGRLHGPIGLDLGARTPAEIAVSIVAEIVAVKNCVALAQKKAGSATPSVGNACGVGGG
jgi:hypothetical protein